MALTNTQCKYCSKPLYRHMIIKSRGSACRECQDESSRKRARDRYKNQLKKMTSIFNKCDECDGKLTFHREKCPVRIREADRAWRTTYTRKPKYEVVRGRLERVK